MPITTKRYFQVGGAVARLRSEIDPALQLVVPRFVLSVDLTWDTDIADEGYVDSILAARGAVPDTQNTSALSPEPFLGILSPDDSIWKIQVDNAGAISTLKVS